MNLQSTQLAVNRATVRRLYEDVMNGGNIELLPELVVPDYAEHSPLPGQAAGIVGFTARLTAILNGFRPRYELHHVVAEADIVAVHWTMTGTHQAEVMGIAPTNRPVKFSGIDVHRLRDGKLAEHWHVIEALQMMQQLGVLPGPPG